MDRHGLRPRDDKGGTFTMKGVKRLEFSLCHCEEDRMDDAAIHRVSGNAGGLSVRLLVHSGSPRAFNRRDDKGGILP